MLVQSKKRPKGNVDHQMTILESNEVFITEETCVTREIWKTAQVQSEVTDRIMIATMSNLILRSSNGDLRNV